MANHDGHANDTTDNLPQKYYTIMLEKIPAELRSAEKLVEHFEELFPGSFIIFRNTFFIAFIFFVFVFVFGVIDLMDG